MLNELLKLAERIGVTILFLNNFYGGGCYLPEYDVIHIQENLPYFKKIYVLAHELSHAINHKDYFSQYNSSFVGHSKMEFEADLDTINFLVEHIEDLENFEPEQINFLRFMDQYEIDYSFEPVVKAALSDYIYHTKAV